MRQSITRYYLLLLTLVTIPVQGFSCPSEHDGVKCTYFPDGIQLASSDKNEVSDTKKQNFITKNSGKRKKKDPRGTYSLQVENDLFTGTDKHFTHGGRLSYVSAENSTYNWLLNLAHKVPFFEKGSDIRTTLAVGQNIYTPSDITIEELQLDERPYAGWLYTSAGMVSENGNRMDNVDFTLGMVGPASLAEESQKYVHKNISNSPTPMGWEHQLKNEPGFIVTYERTFREMFSLKDGGLDFDISRSAGGSIGNVFTHANASLTARLGRDLPSDYGVPRIRPSLPNAGFFAPQKEWGWYAFLGIGGRLVARNIFLDGNTFADSHSVNKRFFVGDIQTGLVFTFHRYRISYTQIFRTEEFEKQKRPDQFGSLNISVKF